MHEVLNGKKISASEATSSLIKAVLKMSADEIISLLNDIEQKEPEMGGEPRIDYCAEVAFSVEERFYTGYIASINASGVFIETNNDFKTGQNLTLSFELPNESEYVKLTGTIDKKGDDGIDVLFDSRLEEFSGMASGIEENMHFKENYC